MWPQLPTGRDWRSGLLIFHDFIEEHVSPISHDFAYGSELHFPLFGSGLGWETEFVIINQSGPARAEMLFFDVQGTPLGHPVEFDLPTFGSFTVIAPSGDSGDPISGSATLRFFGELHGFTRFRVHDNGWAGARGTANVVSLESQGSRGSAVPVKIGPEQTYISLRNPFPDKWINPRLQLFSVDGRFAGEKSDIYIPPNGRYVEGLHILFPGYLTTSLPFRGMLRVEAGAKDTDSVWVGAFEIGTGVFNGLPVIHRTVQ